MKDVIASYESLVCLLERIQFFLQRLHHYTSVPLTPEMTELLAKIMAQILSILALSTKTMKEKRISWSIQSIYFSVADCSSRNIYEEANGKDRCGKRVSKFGYPDERGESDDGGENLRGHTPRRQKGNSHQTRYAHHFGHFAIYQSSHILKQQLTKYNVCYSLTLL